MIKTRFSHAYDELQKEKETRILKEIDIYHLKNALTEILTHASSFLENAPQAFHVPIRAIFAGSHVKRVHSIISHDHSKIGRKKTSNSEM